MTIQELDTQKEVLLKRANELTALKNKLFGNVDIESPMSDEEKEVTKNIADCYSEINAIVINKRKLKLA